MTARVEITKNTVSPALGRLLDTLEGNGRDLMLRDMGEYLMGSTAARAARQVTPAGEAWPALSPRYKRRKDKLRPGLPMLKYDNHMLGDGLSYQVPPGEGALYHGTSVRYGAAQHFGYGGIQPRNWLGLSDEDGVELVAIAQDHIARAVEG